MINDDKLSQQLVEAMFNSQLNEIIQAFPDYDVVAFIKSAIDNPDFGQKGHYHFYCKHCGGSWSFGTKTEVKVFTKIHKTLGCQLAYAMQPPNIRSEKQIANGKPIMKKDPRLFLKRQNQHINPYILDVKEKVEKTEEEINEPALTAETDLPLEPALTAAQ